MNSANAPTTHFMLVSEQAAPNLLAALDPQLKPDEAVLLVSRKMRHRADALQAVLRETGVKATRVDLEDEHDIAKVEEALLTEASLREGQRILMHVTGGNKLMALAAQAVAQTAGWPAFYVDVDTDQVIWLDRSAPPHKLSQQLRLRHYLQSYGFSLASGASRPQIDKSYDVLAGTLVMNVVSLEDAIGQLNWIGQEAEDRRVLQVQLNGKQLDSVSLTRLLQNFEQAGVLRLQGDTLHYASEDARFFSKGGWLEHYVYQTLCQVGANLQIRDKAANLMLEDREGNRSELDVTFMARNRLFVIECKTARMDRSDGSKANDTLHKLSDNCRRVGGLGTQGLLATYRPLRESEMRLASALRIEVVTGYGLARLDERLKQWVTPIA